MKKSLWVGIAGALTIGCSVGGGIEAKKVAFLLPPGYTKGESNDKNISVGIPAGWRQGVDKTFDMSGFNSAMNSNTPSSGGIDPNQPPLTADEKKMMEGFATTMNEISKEEEEAHLDRLQKNGIILMVISTGKQALNEDRTRFYVKKQTQSTNWTWEDAAKAQLDKFNRKVAPTLVTLPIGKAYRMQETWQKPSGANHTTIAYAIPNGRDLYSLRFVTEEAPEIVTNIDKQVAESFRIN